MDKVELVIALACGGFFATMLAVCILMDGRTGERMRRKGALRDR